MQDELDPVRRAPPSTPRHGLRRVGWAAGWLGFGLGGFFDGILLHQILQWHHLLSGVAPDGTSGGTLSDLRFQILADGLFHALTFTLTLVGLALLWSARTALAASGADRRLAGAALLGFGAWHALDAVLFHWLIGLHRIRMDTDAPLLWDLAWFVPFALLPAALGLRLLRRPPGVGGPPGPPRRAGATAAALALAAALAGPLSALPPAGLPDDRALVVFRAGMDLPAVAAAAEAVGATPVWSDAAGGVWLLALERGTRPSALYRHGALMVSAGPVAPGCLGWSTPGPG